MHTAQSRRPICQGGGGSAGGLRLNHAQPAGGGNVPSLAAPGPGQLPGRGLHFLPAPLDFLPEGAGLAGSGPRLEEFSPMAGGYGVMGDDGSIDYTVHEAWNEATNVYLIVILVSFGLFMYAKRNKRRIMRIFSVPPTEETLSEPNFYDTISKIRLRQQLEMYSISRKYDYQQPQNQADSVQLSLE
ncbi:small integral membrane protein 19 isoform X1 [Trachypithecus francoisi]|uniref:small integral membrane protein 19 isoform X1 n=1 Tax=Trachypithecus francoisi TaxID=54180 RepID=UPI00141AC7C8|nr:small integral membrane protein 19 isoform X1 [Trachypithecus francoisi]